MKSLKINKSLFKMSIDLTNDQLIQIAWVIKQMRFKRTDSIHTIIQEFERCVNDELVEVGFSYEIQRDCILDLGMCVVGAISEV